nr:hypothetical protein 44 [bacterium]
MAKKKKPSLLQQQRAKLKAQRAAKPDSTPRLPGKGKSSAGSVRARVQRGVRRDALAKRQVETFGRALKKTLKQGSAQDKLKKAAKGTKGSGVRTAGAGGGLAKSKGSKVTKYSGKQPGGKIVKSPSGKAVDGKIQKVNVRVEGRKGLRPGDNAKKVGSGSSTKRGLLKGGKGKIGKMGALNAISVGAAIGEAYASTNRAKAVSGRGAGRATFNEKPKKKKKKGLSNIPPSEGTGKAAETSLKYGQGKPITGSSGTGRKGGGGTSGSGGGRRGTAAASTPKSRAYAKDARNREYDRLRNSGKTKEARALGDKIHADHFPKKKKKKVK